MKKVRHVISRIIEDSIAEELGMEPGDELLKINGQEIKDIFDYQYLVQDEYIEVLIRRIDGEEWLLEIDKEYDEDLGIEFENGLMDDYRSCHNKCIFCFIDQMPKGMRETLYFKDDDARLSFLQGNYVTLTNMSDEDVERIIRYHLSPINISFQTTNPELRCMMLHNRFAGQALMQVRKLYEAGITMNGQIVLCKGVNDGAELERSIVDLTAYLPHRRVCRWYRWACQNTGKGCIRWSLLRGRMHGKCCSASTNGRRNFIRGMDCTSYMPQTNGMCWQGSRCRRKNVTTGICSWRTAWGCCGCC